MLQEDLHKIMEGWPPVAEAYLGRFIVGLPEISDEMEELRLNALRFVEATLLKADVGSSHEVNLMKLKQHIEKLNLLNNALLQQISVEFYEGKNVTPKLSLGFISQIERNNMDHVKWVQNPEVKQIISNSRQELNNLTGIMEDIKSS
ncbi:MAG: hypothetical protein AAF902_03120 [Chloroflexota bacterium]